MYDSNQPAIIVTIRLKLGIHTEMEAFVWRILFVLTAVNMNEDAYIAVWSKKY